VGFNGKNWSENVTSEEIRLANSLALYFLHSGLHASSLILNAAKHLAGLPDHMHLLPSNMIEKVTFLKKEVLTGKMTSLDLEETLIMLGISAISKPACLWVTKGD
jgi:uncharacterized protein (UPF0371 family)